MLFKKLIRNQIGSSTPFIQKLDVINEKRKAREISTYDFSTLYTKLPHDDLIRVLGEIIDFVFEGGKHTKTGNRKFLSTTNTKNY